jgi:hypothetical protein
MTGRARPALADTPGAGATFTLTRPATAPATEGH